MTTIARRLTYGLPVEVRILNGDSTLVEVTGPYEAVGDWWQAYLRSYHPFGYSTRMLTDETVDGVRTIKCTRDSSCD